MIDTDQMELPSITTQSTDVNLAWKKVFLDLCTEHLRDGLLANERQSSQKLPNNRRSAFQLPTSDSVHLLDTDQLWQSLEFQNKSILPATKRKLRRLLPTRQQTDGPTSGYPHVDKENQNANIEKGNSEDRLHDGSEDSSSIADPTSGINGPDVAANTTRGEAEGGNSNTGDPSFHEDRETAAISDDEEPYENEKVMKKRRLIEALEEKSIAPKAWALRGEVAASSRPKNSLLESTFEYDTAGKPNFLAVGDLNGDIEDLIKRRIADARFDDVVPREAPIAAVSEERAHEALDTLSEKPSKGLGELYEEEYRESDRSKQNTLDSSATTTGERKEITELYVAFERVAQKLDALSSLTVAPLINDIPKTAAEAVPEDAIKEEAMVNVEGMDSREISSRNRSGSRDQRKKKRRKRAAV